MSNDIRAIVIFLKFVWFMLATLGRYIREPEQFCSGTVDDCRSASNLLGSIVEKEFRKLIKDN